MLCRNSEDELWSRFVFELLIWTQPSGPIVPLAMFMVRLMFVPNTNFCHIKICHKLHIDKCDTQWQNWNDKIQWPTTKNDLWKTTTINNKQRLASCKWSSTSTSPLQMIIRIDQPLENDHLNRLASCKQSCWWTGLLQTIIRINWPLANDNSDQPASCKWSSWSTGLLQMIIRMDQPLANNYPDGQAFWKW